MMTTLLLRHPEQYLQKNRFTRYLQYFRVVGPSYIYIYIDRHFRNSTLGLRELSAKTRTWAGGRFFGDDDDIVLRTPRTICAHTPRTTSKDFNSTPSYAEVWALGVLASPFHVQLALFLMLIRCCASGFRSIKTFLAAPAFCTVFTAFSTSRPPVV